jgi:hypothetical protein
MKRAFALILVAACGSDDAAPPEADQLACNRLQVGPFQSDVIGDVRDGTAPEVTATVVARLTAASGGGFAWLGVDAAGDHGVYLSRDVTVEVTDAAGAVIAPTEDAAGSAACDEIGHRVVVPLTVGVYYLELGVGTDTLDVVTEPVAVERD